MDVGILLFNNFETLDVFGPVEILGRLKDQYKISFYSLSGGIVLNSHNVEIMTSRLDIRNKIDVFLIPGGMGTRQEVDNVPLIQSIIQIATQSNYVLTVCTGSALLAKAGLLDGKRATSNKRAFLWVKSQGLKVNWIHKARWTVDGKFYTSSGVSAGMDMTLGFLSDRHGIEFARRAAKEIEYSWHEDKEQDDFCDR